MTALAIIGTGCGGSDSDELSTGPVAAFEFPASTPGDIVGLIARDDLDDRSIEWIDRLDGTIQRLSLDDANSSPEIIAEIPIGSDGEQRGLLGQVIIDGRRFAAWTQPDTFELVVGEVVDGGPGNLIWSAGNASSGAIGGVLGELDGRVLIGVGRNTGFDRQSEVGGAMLSLDPNGPVDQTPTEISLGYTNPWAFTAADNGEVWVADNAAGPDPADENTDDIERIGRADLVDDRSDMTRIVEAGRAPTAMIQLPDGRLGICGFLDNELRAYEIIDGAEADPGNPATADLARSELVRAGTIMPCLTGAAIFDDGTIVTAALGDPGMQLTVLRP